MFVHARKPKAKAKAGVAKYPCAIGLAASFMIPLSGCGGGGAEANPSALPIAVTPPPTPPPSPPPAPPATSIFGALAQTTSQPFALLGFNYSGFEVGGWGDFAVDPKDVDPDLPIGLRFLAPGQLLLTLSSLGEGTLIPSGGGGFDALGQPSTLSYRTLGGDASLSLIGTSGAYLASSAVGRWTSAPSNGAPAVYRVAEFAYGVPTPSTQVPSTGTISYAAQIYGLIAMASPSNGEAEYYQGSAQLSIDFGSRTVTGTIASGSPNFTTYTVAEASLGADRTSFQGRLTSSNGGDKGFIEGRLTGPSAREMIVRWRAPITISGQSALAFGVWGSAGTT